MPRCSGLLKLFLPVPPLHEYRDPVLGKMPRHVTEKARQWRKTPSQHDGCGQRLKLLDPPGPNFGIEAEKTDSLTEKGGLALVALYTDDVGVRAADCQDEAGKTCPGTEVRRGRTVADQIGYLNAILDMPPPYLLGRGRPDEIDPAVPRYEVRKISFEAVSCFT